MTAHGKPGRVATQVFESFRVRTDCRVTLERDGERLPPQQLFKDVLIRGGQHKIFRYYEPYGRATP